MGYIPIPQSYLETMSISSTRVPPDHAPKGICEVPFTFQDVTSGKETKLHFYAGHMDGKYNKNDDTIEIAYFWCAAHDKRIMY